MGKEHRLVVLGAPGVGKSGKPAIVGITSIYTDMYDSLIVLEGGCSRSGFIINHFLSNSSDGSVPHWPLPRAL